MRLRAGAIVTAAMALILGFLPPAHANWFGITGVAGLCVGGNITDNHDMYFAYTDTTTALTNAANWTRTNLMNPTDLNTFTVSSPTDHTDVVVLDRYYDNYCDFPWTKDGNIGLRGFTSCEVESSTHRCDQQVVRISDYSLDLFTTDGDRTLVCHEFGHAIGLKHRDNPGCMKNGDFGESHYTDHDRAHINSDWSTEPAS